MARRKFLNKKTVTLGVIALGAYLLYRRQGSVAGLGFSFGKARRGIAAGLKRVPAATPGIFAQPMPATLPGLIKAAVVPAPRTVPGNVISFAERLRNRQPIKTWGQLRPFGK